MGIQNIHHFIYNLPFILTEYCITVLSKRNEECLNTSSLYGQGLLENYLIFSALDSVGTNNVLFGQLFNDEKASVFSHAMLFSIIVFGHVA